MVSHQSERTYHHETPCTQYRGNRAEHIEYEFERIDELGQQPPGLGPHFRFGLRVRLAADRGADSGREC
jgi:hypothetical protein